MNVTTIKIANGTWKVMKDSKAIGTIIHDKSGFFAGYTAINATGVRVATSLRTLKEAKAAL